MPILDGESLIHEIKHYLSVLSGPIIACFCGSFLTLVPIHNVLEQPQFWYEDQLSKAIPVVPMIVSQILIHAEYWSNFKFEKKWQTYVFSIGLAYLTYFGVMTGYHFIWTYYLGYYHPLPMNQVFIGGAMVVITCAFIWTRYS